MTAKVIEIIVASNGEARVETRGFRGSECREASSFLEEALGLATTEQLTAEFHEHTSQQQSSFQGN